MGHSYTALFFHCVFSTKHREPWIGEQWQERLYAYAGGIIRAERGDLIAAGGMPDHIHLLIHAHASTPIADLMRIVKSRTSGWVHETISCCSEFGWQNGYGGFSVSASALDEVKAYIANQAEHHRHMSTEEEFLGLLRKHGVEFDPRYVFE